ncbi:MAG: hypothetical protein JJ911_19250 [Rhizobiaceae bacterium]|nr:hypothetical protein [Rhizobiaceae bacterium]
MGQVTIGGYSMALNGRQWPRLSRSPYCVSSTMEPPYCVDPGKNTSAPKKYQLRGVESFIILQKTSFLRIHGWKVIFEEANSSGPG